MKTDLKWQLTIDQIKGALVISYTLENKDTVPIRLMDRVIVFAPGDGFEINDTAIIVRPETNNPGNILFTRGYVKPPHANADWELIPGVRTLNLGETAKGVAEIQLPLAYWHPNEGESPIYSKAEKAVLELGILPAHLKLTELRLKDNSTIEIPSPADAFQFQELVRSAPQPVPMQCYSES